MHVDEVDLEDLVEVVSHHFGGARYERDREIGFPNDGDARLTLRFSKDLRGLEEVWPGPGLEEATLSELDSKITAELVQSTGTRYGTSVVFSVEPVTGFWRYQDRLQLRPVPDASPRPRFLYADHPALLDFTYRGSGDVFANMRRRERAATRWAQRFNILVMPGLKMADRYSHHAWVLVPDSEGVLHSQYLQEGYWPEGVTNDETSLADPGCDPIEREPALEYYNRLGTTNAPMMLPDTFENSLAAIEALPGETLLRFDRAAYWFDYAGHRARAQSAMAVALGATIEAMFEPTAVPRCRSCGGDVYKATARFIDFMTAHLPGPDAEGARRLFGQLYGLRSRPAHGHVLDFDFLPSPSFMPARLDEDEKVRSLFRFVRLALVNWLEQRDPASRLSDPAAAI